MVGVYSLPTILSLLITYLVSVSADYVKLEASKLRGSWPQHADVDIFPIVGFHEKTIAIQNDQGNLTHVNGTASSLFNDKIYYAIDLNFGSNNQTISVLVDTGSSDLWVNSIDNEVCVNGIEGHSNFTINYEYTISSLSSSTTPSSSSASSFDSSTIQSLSTSYTTSYNSESDVYVVVGNVLTETTTTTVQTFTQVSTKSYDTQFYPSLASSASSTSWLDQYPHPTFPIGLIDVLEPEDKNCTSWGVFDSNSSSSFIDLRKTFESVSLNTEFFDYDSVSGNWGKDFISFGNISLNNISFGVVTESDSDAYGVLGLGLPESESTYLYSDEKYDNFPVELKNQGFIRKIVYSIYDNYLTGNSSLLFGGIDLQQFNDNLTVVPLIEFPFAHNDSREALAVGLTISSLSYVNYEDEIENKNENTTSLLASGLGAALIDTSSSITSLPYYIYDEIVSQTGFAYSEPIKSYIINETLLDNKSLIFDFQGVQIEVPIIDLTFPLLNLTSEEVSDFVTLGVDARGDDLFVLGDSVLQNMYLAIDLEDKEIALASKNFGPEFEDIVAIESSFPNATTALSYNYTYGYHDVTQLKLATVNDPNEVSSTSLSGSFIASRTHWLPPITSSYARVRATTELTSSTVTSSTEHRTPTSTPTHTLVETSKGTTSTDSHEKETSTRTKTQTTKK